MKAMIYKTTMRSGMVRWSSTKREATKRAKGEHNDGWPSTVRDARTDAVVATFDGQPLRRNGGRA